MKVSIIGCTHAGTFAAQQILTEHPDWKVSVFERNDNLSFLSCGIALWVSERVSDPNKMFYSSPDDLAKLGAHMMMQHNVNDVDLDNKKISVTNLVTNETFEETYDKLVITTGSAPIIPNIEGIDDNNVFLCKNWRHAEELKKNADGVKSVVVIGAGYIGAELAEGYSQLGKEVTLIDALPHVLGKNFDENISEVAEDDFKKNGVNLALNEKVVKFIHKNNMITVVTDTSEYTADIAVLCIGFRPNTDLFKNKLDMIDNGAIIVDKYMHTSHKDVFAAGDSATVFYNPTQKNDYIPLATNAVRQGILIGKNIEKDTLAYLGTQSTSAVELFGRSYAGSGLTSNGAAARKVKVDTVSFEDNYRPEFMLSTQSVLLNLTWNPENHEVLGGSLTSMYDISQSANVLSLAIHNHMTIEDLSMVDFFFQPNFDKPINYIAQVAGAAVAKANS